MPAKTAEPMGERLNDEPVIFRGYTDSEFILAVGIAIAVCFPAGLFTGALLGSIAMGIGLSAVVAIGLVVLGASAYQNWKRGRPGQWLQQRMALFLAELRLSGARMLKRRGAMSLGRDDLWRRL